MLVRNRFFYFLKDKFPTIKNPLLFRFNPIKCLTFIIRTKIQEFNIRIRYDMKRFYVRNNMQIAPQKIQFILKKKLNKYSLVMKGDWDRPIEYIDMLSIFNSFKQRFIEGKKWEETIFYKTCLSQITNNLKNRFVKNQKELYEKLISLDLIYSKIEKEKINSKDKIDLSNKILKNLIDQEVISKILVAIDRDGRFLLVEGLFGLVFVQFLKIQKIPIKIIARHKKWVNFRKELFFSSMNYQLHKVFYQRFSHPDLQLLPYKHGDFRFNLIKENLKLSQGIMLDIGANFGYFCHKFEDDGFQCYAVELNPMHVYFMKKLKKAENRQFKIINKSIFDFKKDQILKFDVVLALNIFYHFCKKKETYFEFIKLLKRLRTKVLYFEAHKPWKLKNTEVYRNYAPDEFVEFIIKNTSLTKSKYIGENKYGRRLYEISNENYSS